MKRKSRIEFMRSEASSAVQWKWIKIYKQNAHNFKAHTHNWCTSNAKLKCYKRYINTNFLFFSFLLMCLLLYTKGHIFFVFVNISIRFNRCELMQWYVFNVYIRWIFIAISLTWIILSPSLSQSPMTLRIHTTNKQTNKYMIK